MTTKAFPARSASSISYSKEWLISVLKYPSTSSVHAEFPSASSPYSSMTMTAAPMQEVSDWRAAVLEVHLDDHVADVGAGILVLNQHAADGVSHTATVR